MKKKVSALGLGLILVINFVVIIDMAPGVSGATIFVDDDYTVEDANHKMTIQAAVNAANLGDEVFVYSGYYTENVWIDKTINLTGEDRNNTIIDGGLNADSVTVFASWVNVTEFTITGGNPYGVYITSFSHYNTISNNIISNNFDCGVQIYWFSDHNVIANNTISNHSNCGVQILYGNDFNKVADNVIKNSTTSSVSIANPSGASPNFNNIVSNNIINNSQFGVYLYNLNDDNLIEGNFINKSQYGIMLSTSNDNNEISRNTILTSSMLNIYLWNSNNNNLIYHNNLLNDQGLAYDDGVNSWNLSYPGGGNFWGNYSGGDNRSGPAQNKYGNDGFGDVPITLGGGSNMDYYPLWPNWDALEYYRPSPQWKNVCEYALGDIEVGVIFVESNGSIDTETENWSQSRKTQVLGEIAEGLSWWEAQEADANLNFSINDLGSKNTSYEPIGRINTDSELWVEEILGNMGFTSGNYLERLLYFNHWLRGQSDTDWAFTIFVVDSYNDTDGYFANPPTYAWAWWFLGGIVMTYDNDNWGITRMNNITAHETGHMFYATDEYADPGERSGYLNELEVDDSEMLMDNNKLDLSSGSKLQVGWKDSDSDGVMDILDTEPNTHLVPYEPDPTYNNSPIYAGYSVVVPYPNNNPNGFGLDITLNTITKVQYRIDNGSWQNASAFDGAFDEDIEEFSFTLSGLSAGTHFIEARAFNNVNNSDPTYANDTITILSDLVPPEILETTVDVPVSGKFYNVTADVVDDFSVDSVWLEYSQISLEGFSEKINVSMNGTFGDSYWYKTLTWINATWFNYSISAVDASSNWNVTTLRALQFRVHNLDSGFGFTTIQYSIDDVDTLERHTIFVEEGIYYENVDVDKSINLTGEDRDTTIIDGGGVGDVVRITMDYVYFTGFKTTGGGSAPDDSGIKLVAQFCIIEYNNCSGNGYYGIALYNWENNTIRNNTCLSNTWNGINLENSDHNIIEDNTCSNSIVGIRLSSSNYNIIENNVLSNNSNGIFIGSSHENNITDNICFENGYGILLDSSNYHRIVNNICLSNTWAGIQFQSSCSNNLIVYNNCSINNANGISFHQSYNNTLINNTFSLNNYGIYLFISDNNRIYHNIIINNTNQAYDDSNNGNQWDNGYPSGGNYWSDYSGEDLYSGPNQDIIGNDGIGDTNYTIDSDSVDNYPLLSGIGDNIFLYEGWNLISIPAIQSVSDLSSVLAPIFGSYDAVEWYDITDSNDLWKHNHISKPSEMNDLHSINHTMGFFIHITDTPGVVFEYEGVKLSVNQTITLHKGWNLVGFPSHASYNRSVGLNNLEFGTDADTIQWFDASAKTWNFLETDDLFVPGRGYWIHSKVETTWEVPL